jgi:diacylglycerol kinase family enzyme
MILWILLAAMVRSARSSKAGSTPTLLQLWRHFAAIAHGHQVLEPRSSTYQGQRFRIVNAARPTMPVQADGQVVGHTPALTEVVPKALMVIAPYSPRSV